MVKFTKRISRLIGRNGKTAETYGQLVTELIRRRYTLSDELSILRKRDEKPEEFAEYNAYAEECKALAKLEMLDVEGTT